MDEYLTINELAARWKCTRKTLENYRNKGVGPKPFPLFPGNRGLRYRQSEVVAYEDAQNRANGIAPAAEGAAS